MEGPALTSQAAGSVYAALYICVVCVLLVHIVLFLPAQSGWTALMAASRSNQPQIIEMLLKAGADPNLQGEVRFFPIV